MAASLKPRIVLACCSDAAYAPHAATMLFSALHRTPDASFDVHYLHDPGFPEQTKKTIRRALSRYASRLQLNFIEVADEMVSGLPLFSFMKPGSMPPVMWYRIFLPQLLPQESKVLYLDCDTLIVTSLLPLWQIDLADKALAAVTNPSWSGEKDRSWHTTCGLENREDYFNSGVMLLNLDQFRARQWSEAILAHGRANGHWTLYGDQDSLVVVLHKHRLPLAPRWNVMRIIALNGDSRRIFSPAEMDDVIRKPAIIHFEGSTKPWINATKHPWGRAHSRYARKLPWPVQSEPWQLLDIENFLIRQNWPRLRKYLNSLRHKLAPKD